MGSIRFGTQSEGGAGRVALYNALLTLGPDGWLLNHHRKLLVTYTERLVWGAGAVERAWVAVFVPWQPVVAGYPLVVMVP